MKKLKSAVSLNKSSNRVIIMTHGFLGSKDESHNLFLNLSPLLEKRYNVIRYDCRGCGENPDNVDDRTLDNWVTDLDNITNDIQTNDRYSHISSIDFLGFSLGSVINLIHYSKSSERYDDSSFVFLAPAFRCDLDMFKRYKKTQKGNFIQSGLLVNSNTIDSLNIDISDILKSFDKKSLIIHSEEDPTIPISRSRETFEQFKSKDKEFMSVSGCGHSFRNDLDLSPRKKVYDKICSFLN